MDAAGIADQRLRAAYRRCRQIAAENGRTYFLATRLLAPDQRPAVHALYGFARHADDILDELNPALDVGTRAERLQALSDRFFAGDHHDEPVLAAVGDTARRYGIPADLFEDFLASMRMDLTVTDYPDRAALDRYMRGSAEVIGLQMLPILGTVSPTDEAAPTPPRWAARFSSPISCATSPRISPATGSTYRPTNSPPSAWTGNC